MLNILAIPPIFMFKNMKRKQSSISSILFNSALKLADCEDTFMMLEAEFYERGKYSSDYLHLVLTE